MSSNLKYRPRQKSRPSPRNDSSRKTETAFSQTLRKVWIDQLAFLAKRKKAPTTASQIESFFSYLAETYKHSVKSLWEGYNVQRSKTEYLRVTEAQHAISYVMAFHPNNIQRNSEILKRVESETSMLKALSQVSTLHILDIGCGAGAWSASVLDQLYRQAQQPEISLDLIDRSKYLLQAAEIGITQNFALKRIKTLQSDLRDQKAAFVLQKILKRCEENRTPLFVGMSYVWNEFNSAKAKENLLRLLHQFFASSVPVIFDFAEPGREAEAREAMDFRQWMQNEGLHIVYPCPHQQSCPMLKDGLDWCYSEVPNHDLKEWKWLSDILKLKRQRLSTASYVALNSAAKDLLTSEMRNGPKGRIVGFPEVAGRNQTLLCSQGQLHRNNVFYPRIYRGENELKIRGESESMVKAEGESAIRDKREPKIKSSKTHNKNRSESKPSFKRKRS